MPTDAEAIRDRLLQSDEEFRQLSTKHQELDTRLHELSHKHYFSDSEQFEAATLKKRKLQLKDRMEDIVRQHRDGDVRSVSEASSSHSASHG
jgi:uncharacterized protein YdcH (DUF465 family)